MALRFAWAIVLHFLLVARATQRGIYFACYDEADKGRSYRGLESMTASGSRCAESSHNGIGLCRNPDGSMDKPWCVSGNDNVKETCNVDKCGGIPISLAAINVTSSQVLYHQNVRLSPAYSTNRQLSQYMSQCFVSIQIEVPAWWQADLLIETVVTGIGFQLLSNVQRDVLYAMTEIDMLVGSISDSSSSGISFNLCGRVAFEMDSSTSTIYRKCGKIGMEGRYIRIQSSPNKIIGISSLYLCEVQINSGSMLSAKQCEAPLHPNNGTVTGEEFFYPKRIRFNCKPGFDINGQGIFFCNHRGQWESVVHPHNTSKFPSCKPKFCRNPPLLKNSEIVGDDYHFPSRVTYKCQVGFCMIGTSAASCLANGTWSKESRNCKRVWCRSLKHPQNGTVLVPDRPMAGKTANYTCDRGFVLRGPSSRLCAQTRDQRECLGKWSGEAPTCKPELCQKASSKHIRKGAVVGDKFFYPEIIQFICQEGHRLQGGGSKWQCNYDGEWTDMKYNRRVGFPTCEPKDCGPPDKPKNCNMDGKNYHFPGVVNFTSDRGYCVDGATQLKCTSNGTWSKELTTCKPILCPRLRRPPHGEITMSSASTEEGSLVDTRVTYSCEDGYDLNMNSTLLNYTRQCRQFHNITRCGGYWSGTEPCCLPRSCSDPHSSDFRNGVIVGRDYFYPETIRLNCSVGHELRGGGSVFQCSHRGQWVEVKSPQVDSQMMMEQRVRNALSRANRCLGAKAIVTTHHVTKTPNLPTCESKDCGKPKINKNCRSAGNYFQYQGVVSFSTDHGYCVDGAAQISCNSSGLWSRVSPTCKRVECPTLQPPSHGEIELISKKRYVGDAAKYTCEPGYDLNMDRTLRSFVRRCSQSGDIHQCTGLWADVEPCCIPRSCPDPKLSNFRNGTISGTSYFYPETIRLDCVVGHELVGGGPLFKCSQDGRWIQVDKRPATNQQLIDRRTKTERDNVRNCLKTRQIVTKHHESTIRQFPTCQPKDCGKPNINKNCRSTGNYFQYPAAVAFTGDHGYCVHGAAKLSCNASGLWSRDSPSCKRVQCIALEPPSHSKIELISKSRYVDDAANYTCEPGYDLNMERTLQSFVRNCSQSGDIHQCTGFWSDVEPCCIPRSCPDPNSSNFRNGTISGKSFFYPETIRFDCIVGHELVGGGPLFQCSQDGRWVEIDKVPVTNQLDISDRIKTEQDNVRRCLNKSQIVTNHHNSSIRQFPTCQPKNCFKPTLEPNCIIMGNYFQYPGVIRFNRDDGYCVEGAIGSKCTLHGSWSNGSPTCRRIQCPSLAYPRNGNLSISHERHVGDKANYTCNKGYDLNMDRRILLYTRICNQKQDVYQCDGIWGESEPCCIPRSCQDPNQTPFVNGNIVGKYFFYQETISLICDYGHFLTRGGPVYQCNELGSWVEVSNPVIESAEAVNSRGNAELKNWKRCLNKSGRKETIVTISVQGQTSTNSFPRCEAVKCTTPARPANGDKFGRYFQFKGVVRFICDKGFYLKGESQIVCLGTGEWSHNPPECKSIQCPTLENDTCMYVSATNRSGSREAQYIPHPGHYLVGDTSRTCNQTEPIPKPEGFWTGVPPECKDLFCKTPLPIPKGTYLGNTTSNTFPIGSQVRYYCFHGYEIRDSDSNRKCLWTGLWSGQLPRCQHVCAEAEHRTSSAEHCVVKEDGTSELSCLGKTACPSDYTPVCASDTKTYNNRCRMKIASCGISGKYDNEVARNRQCSFGGICLESRPKPLAGVQCSGAYYRYYHNSEYGKCERYVHGSCFEGHNVFYTTEDCQEICMKNNPCFLDLDPGVCGLHKERFYYNLTEEKCVKFNYTGCFGNENNFPSKSKCEMRCNVTRITPAPVGKTPEQCCPPVLKKRCSADLVLDVDATSQRRLTIGRVWVRVRIAPKSLEGQTVRKYRLVDSLYLPTQESTVNGCSIVCPHFRRNTKYLVLVREVQMYRRKMLSTETYRLIPYNSYEKSRVLADLKQCKK